MAWRAFRPDPGNRERLTGSPQKDRRLMAERLRQQGISDSRVLKAMSHVPRHRFVSDEHWDEAYANYPLPIDNEQTISQPYIVALMSEALALRPSDRVLEIGTGSGYQTAVLAELAAHVYSVERSALLLAKAERTLHSLGIANVEFRVGDGSLGWAEAGPFDAIIVTAAAPSIPPSLRDQISPSGRLVLPVGGRRVQALVRLTISPEGEQQQKLCDCSFLPLIGREGWPDRERSSST